MTFKVYISFNDFINNKNRIYYNLEELKNEQGNVKYYDFDEYGIVFKLDEEHIMTFDNIIEN
jgi:hypothetical protein